MRVYRPDIDGLRAIAVLSVVAFHAFPKQVPGGFVGVDIFFVISGFLISGIIFEDLEQGCFSFARFYARRIRRIFPALIIVLAACMVFGWITLWPDEYQQLAAHTSAGAGFVANFVLWREAGYFDRAAELKPLLHLWSLGIEEQFYLVWPALLVLLWKQRQRVQWALAILASLSFALNVLLINTKPSANFYLPFTRFWELLLGSLLVYSGPIRDGFIAAFFSSHVRRQEAFNNVVAFVGAILIAVAVFLIDRERRFPGWWALMPTLGSVFLILAGPQAWINRRVLRSRLLVLIGLISYPLYLWHWPLLSFATIVYDGGKALKVTLIVLSILLAWATWKYVEVKIRNRSNRIDSTTDISALSMALGFVCLLGLVVLLSNGAPGRQQATRYKALLGDIAAFKADRFQYADCPQRSHDFNFCLQSKRGTANAAVVGDSHAYSLFNGLAIIDQGRTWLGIGNLTCPPTLGVIVEGGEPRCAEKMKHAFDYLTSREAPNIIVFAFFGYYAEATDFAADNILAHMGPSQYHLQGDLPQQSKEDVLFDGLKNSIGLLIGGGKRVFLVVDVPELPFLPRDCIKRVFFAKPKNCYLERAAVDRRQRGLRRIVKRLQERFPSLVVFDPLDLLCDGTRCNPVLQDFSYYQDSHHLSLRGSEAVARPLLALIQENQP